MLESHQTDPAAFESRPEWDAVHQVNVYYFLVFHALPFGAFFSGVNRSSIVACFVLYTVRIFCVTAGYHIYFSHRGFKTSRIFQLILAIGAQSSGQGSVVSWAANHHYHHANSDSQADIHSPRQKGFWYSHLGWLFRQRHEYLVTSFPKYLTKFPELVWLQRYYYVPMFILAVLMYLFLGGPGLFVGFGLSTILGFHATFCVNSLTHMFGTRRFDTPDDSRNNWFVSVVMLGGGWHNNHHRYPASARQGVVWWEIDITYYVLRVLAFANIIWGLHEPISPRLKGANSGFANGISGVTYRRLSVKKSGESN